MYIYMVTKVEGYTSIYLSIYIYISIYIHTHTHTHIYWTVYSVMSDSFATP